MRVTSKGQVTIPQDVREELGIEPGTNVEFVQENGKIVLRVVDSRTEFDRWLDSAAGVGKAGLTTDKFMRRWRAWSQ
jgi:AbrB family looped-hinge helix DNA binding protein